MVDMIYPAIGALAMKEDSVAYYVCLVSGQNNTLRIEFSEWNALCSGASEFETFNHRGEYAGKLFRVCDKLKPEK